MIHSASDGRRYNLRQIQPSDRDHLLHGVERMSPETRYQRFLANKTSLNSDELDFLIACDGQNHIAYVCRELDDDGKEGIGFGVARFYRDPKHPTWGEVAVVIVDDWQGVGVGKVLLRALAEHCRRVEVEGWYATMAGENHRALSLFEKFGSIVSRVWEDRIQTLQIRLNDS